jgi:3-hydroxy-9,10-secoandrosta-1,3,5(10)-triene-9,17-dione monooxygenase reductase component
LPGSTDRATPGGREMCIPSSKRQVRWPGPHRSRSGRLPVPPCHVDVGRLGMTTETPHVAVTDKDEFRRIMGHYVTGATVVTGTLDGEPHGMAVNSFTSASLDPPLILFCPDKQSETWPQICRSGYFAVNILSSGQDELCRRFARKGVDRFGDTALRYLRSGSPVLRSALAYLDCRIADVHDAGDHFIAVGHVLELGVARGRARPLVFYQGGFHHLRAKSAQRPRARA